MVRDTPTSRKARTLSESEQALVRLVRKRNLGRHSDSQSLSEKAYLALRQAIQEGVIEAGTHLTELDVAAWLEMSRTPVREAMRRLESDGLLLNERFRGAVVITLEEAEIRELYAVRELLEAKAAGACAEHATTTQVESMRSLIEKEAACLDDPIALIDVNRRLHQAICDGAHNRFLQKAWNTIQTSFALLGRSNLLSAARAHAAHEEHALLLSAIVGRHTEAAEAAARTHVRNSLEYRLEALRAPKKSQDE